LISLSNVDLLQAYCRNLCLVFQHGLGEVPEEQLQVRVALAKDVTTTLQAIMTNQNVDECIRYLLRVLLEFAC
jgi:hypothetical protein